MKKEKTKLILAHCCISIDCKQKESEHIKEEIEFAINAACIQLENSRIRARGGSISYNLKLEEI